MRRIFCIIVIAVASLAIWLDCPGQTFKKPILFKNGYSYNTTATQSYYKRTLERVNIKSINGKTTVVIPTFAQKVSGLAMIVNGVPIQYKKIKTGIQIVDVPVKALSYNFSTKKVTPLDYNSDVVFRPTGYAQKMADTAQKPVTVSIGVVVQPKLAEPVIIEEIP